MMSYQQLNWSARWQHVVHVTRILRLLRTKSGTWWISWLEDIFYQLKIFCELLQLQWRTLTSVLQHLFKSKACFPVKDLRNSTSASASTQTTNSQGYQQIGYSGYICHFDPMSADLHRCNIYATISNPYPLKAPITDILMQDPLACLSLGARPDKALDVLTYTTLNAVKIYYLMLV